MSTEETFIQMNNEESAKRFENVRNSKIFRNICDETDVDPEGEILSVILTENPEPTKNEKQIVIEFKSETKKIYGSRFRFFIQRNQFGVKNGEFSYIKFYQRMPKIYSENDFDSMILNLQLDLSEGLE